MDVVDFLGLSRDLVYARLKRGWSLEDAISIPSKFTGKRLLDD